MVPYFTILFQITKLNFLTVPQVLHQYSPNAPPPYPMIPLLLELSKRSCLSWLTFFIFRQYLDLSIVLSRA